MLIKCLYEMHGATIKMTVPFGGSLCNRRKPTRHSDLVIRWRKGETHTHFYFLCIFNSVDSSVVPDTLYPHLLEGNALQSVETAIARHHRHLFAFICIDIPIRKPSSGSCCCRHFEMLLFHKFQHFQVV